MSASQRLSEQLQGRKPVVCCPRPVVHSVGNAVEFVLSVHTQVRALGEVLAQQPVGVLAGPALPRAVRVAEVHRHAGALPQLFVARQLFALVVRQAVAHRLGNPIQLGKKASQCRGGGGIDHLGQQHQTARSLGKDANRRMVARAFDKVALPAAGHHAVLDLGRAHVDAGHVGDLPAPIGASRARQAAAAALAQAGHELAAQLASRLGLNGGVDGLAEHVACGFVREDALEWGDNLLGRPLAVQQRERHAAGDPLHVKLGSRLGGPTVVCVQGPCGVARVA